MHDCAVILDRLPRPVGVFSPAREGGGPAEDFVARHLNAAACRVLGLDPAQAAGRRLGQLLPVAIEPCRAALERRIVDITVGDLALHVEAAGDDVVLTWDALALGGREAEDRLRELADAMPQLVWTADAAGVVTYYNARIREYAPAEDGEGRWRWQPIVHPEDRARTQASWEEAVRRAAPYTCEHRIRKADGTYRWHLSRAQRVSRAWGEVWYGTATDIHDQRQAADAIRRAAATRDQVVSVVAHDLRGPLSVIHTAVPILRKTVGYLDGEVATKGSACVDRVERQTRHMGRLLDELVDVAVMQAGTPLQLQRGRVDLAALVRQLTHDRQSTSLRHPVELEVSDEPLVGTWDGERLARVVGNLLSNAVKYSPAGSVITLTLATEDGHAVLRVKDRGIGIAEADRERIFEWFTRGENAPPAATGAGLGLAGARRIVEQHGGTLTVDSEVGAGSTFTVRLPLSTGGEP